MDGMDIDSKLREKGINRCFGRVKEVKKADYLCVQFHGNTDADCVVLALYDFAKSASEFSRSISSSSTAEFCNEVNRKLIDISDGSAVLPDDENIADTEFRVCSPQRDSSGKNSDTEMEMETEGEQQNLTVESSCMEGSTLSTDQSVNTDELKTNSFLVEVADNVLGDFVVPISCLKYSDEARAVRDLSANHLNDLLRSFETEYKNGYKVQFPEAAGFLLSPVDSTGIQNLTSGGHEIELIDGNHTHHVMCQLHELYPEEDCFKFRKVKVYKNGLDTSLITTLGLIKNEEASNSLRTSLFSKVRIMRRERISKFQGTFNTEYQEHIYRVFNAVCPDDKKEEQRRKKALQHLLRISTIDDSCWSIIEKIQAKYPGHSVFLYREMGMLATDQSKNLLQRVLDGKIKLKDIKQEILKCPKPNQDDDNVHLTFQRLRKQKVVKDDNTGSRKRKSCENQKTSPVKISKMEKYEHDTSKMREENEKLKQTNAKIVKELQETKMHLNNEKKKIVDLHKKLTESKAEIERLQVSNKEKEGLNLKILCDIQELRVKLEEKEKEDHLQEKLNEQVPSLPLSLGAPVHHSTPVKVPSLPFSLRAPVPQSIPVEENAVPPSVILLVEYNNGTIYLGQKMEDSILYCKSALGVIRDGSYVAKERKNSFIINISDKQDLNLKYVIHQFEISVKDGVISKEHLGNPLPKY